MEALLQAGRSVVLAGDLNIAPFPIDHCDLVRASRAEQESMLRGRADRAWFRNALHSAEGPFVDLFRCMPILCTPAYAMMPAASYTAQDQCDAQRLRCSLLDGMQRVVRRRTGTHHGQDSHATCICHGVAEICF